MDGPSFPGSPPVLPPQNNHNDCSPRLDRVSGWAGAGLFMGGDGRGSAGGGRHSPGESGSSPAVPCATKQPLLSDRVSGWAGAVFSSGRLYQSFLPCVLLHAQQWG